MLLKEELKLLQEFKKNVKYFAIKKSEAFGHRTEIYKKLTHKPPTKGGFFYALKTLHRIAHIKSFIQQAVDFNRTYSGMMDNIIKYLSINAACMPWLVLRASELLSWYNSGEYQRIINKSKQIR